MGLVNYPTPDNPLTTATARRMRSLTKKDVSTDTPPVPTVPKKLKDRMRAKYFSTNDIHSYGVGTSSGVFDDDVVTHQTDVIDNGYIFPFAQSVATALRTDPTNGDLYLPRIAYKPMINSVLNELPQGVTSYDALYETLCSIGPNVHNCSVISLFFEGDTDRTISDYNYQPLTSGAYHNTMYNATSFNHIVPNPPVTLIYVSYE